jgi:hypothetical protein
MVMNSDKYYCYVLLDPRKPGKYKYENIELDFEPYYVGKGMGGRIKRHFTKHENDRDYNNIKFGKIKKIKKAGFNPSMFYSFLIKNVTEEDAFLCEKRSILAIGRIDLKTGPLANLTEGGDGTSHLIPKTKGKTYEEIHGKEKAKELKELRKKQMTGKNNPMFGKVGIMLGKKLDSEARKKISIKRRLKVNQLDLDGNFIKTWDTVEEAARHVGIYYSGIQHVASRPTSDRSAGGFRWQYVGREYKPVDKKSGRVYCFTNGEKEISVTNLKEFCKINKLDRSNIKKVIKGKYKSTGGWYLKK